jgi:hypothetical protein
VFVIMLSDEPYASLFGPESKAPYLANTLEHKGELLVRYDSVAHEALAGEVALISGQGPTNETAANCQTYTAIAPGNVGADGQIQGQGCVYPKSTQTIGDQLAAKHLKWRVYVESGNGCSHPALGAADPTSASGAAVEAPTFIDPFLYFTSVTESAACGSQNASLAQLESDLESEATTPNFAYIAPDRCHDANPTPCKAGAAAGPADADSFLESIVPKIMASAAYKKNGLIVITADNAPATGEYADSSSCCGQPTFPNISATPGAGGSVRGGGQVGALLLSPYVKAVAAEHEQEPANTFSLLATFDHFFAVKPLGYAGASGVTPLAPSLFTAVPQAG